MQMTTENIQRYVDGTVEFMDDDGCRRRATIVTAEVVDDDEIKLRLTNGQFLAYGQDDENWQPDTTALEELQLTFFQQEIQVDTDGTFRLNGGEDCETYTFQTPA